MSLIKKINKTKTIDYSNSNLEYFYQKDSTSALISYQKIIDKIQKAKKNIMIAATSNISDGIYDALYQNNNPNIYMIFQSFDDCVDTLVKFDNKNPIVAREVKELNNNFIIIDDISFLLVNPLSQKSNLYVEFEQDKTHDLSFIFNYYFWNCAYSEKLIDGISKPVESPFPPFDNRNLDFININTENINDLDSIFIPRNKEYNENLDIDAENKNFSSDIQIPISLKDKSTQIGAFNIKYLQLDIKNCWALKTSTLSNIVASLDIIPREEEWRNPLKIETLSTITLKDISAETIDNMDNVEPSEFIQRNYKKQICFEWNVLPPVKPSNAKKSSLYNEYKNLDDDFQKRLLLLERKLEDLKNDTNILYSLFSGANKKAKQDIDKLNEYKAKPLTNIKPNDLRDFFNKEFKHFFESIISSEKDFKDNKQKKEEESKWNERKKLKDNELEKKQKEVSDMEKDLLEENSNNSNKQKKKLKKLKHNLDILKKDIENNYVIFQYKHKKNELSYLSREEKQEYKKFTIPKFFLPEIGVLYETKDSYYLEIQQNAELEKANELQQRYIDKNYKVVAGDNNE